MATGKAGRIVTLLYRIHPLPYIIILFSWYHIICSSILFSFKSWVCCLVMVIMFYFLFRTVKPKWKNWSFLATSWLFCFLSSTSIIVSFFGMHNCELFSKQKEVRAVVNFCKSGWDNDLKMQFSHFLKNVNKFSGKDYRQTREIAPSRDGKELYMGDTGPSEKNPTRMFRVSTATNKVDGVSGAIGGANTIVFYEKENLVIGMKPYEHKIDFLDGNTLNLKHSISFPGKIKPLWASVDEKRGKLYALFSNSRYQIAIIDIETAKTEKLFRVAGGAVNEAAFNSKDDELYIITGFAPDGNLLTVFNVKTHKYRNRKLRSFGFGITYDEKRGIIFLSYMFKLLSKGTVEMFDMSTLKSKGFIKSSNGVREMDYDPSTQRLFLGNYITGRLEVVNPFTEKTLASYFVGRKIRRVRYSPVTGRVYVATCNGFVEVDVDKKTDVVH